MRPQQHLHDRLRTPLATVRVFDDVAATPWTPAPRWWNHPVAALTAVLTVAPLLTVVPDVPPMTGFLFALAGMLLALGLAVSRWWWAGSRDDALGEAAWVAGQSGYVLAVTPEPLRWVDDGEPRPARLEPHRGGWRLSLLDARAATTGHRT